jgi:hypothetical protein
MDIRVRDKPGGARLLWRKIEDSEQQLNATGRSYTIVSDNFRQFPVFAVEYTNSTEQKLRVFT